MPDVGDLPGLHYQPQQLGIPLRVQPPALEHHGRLVQDIHQHVPQPELPVRRLSLAGLPQAAAQGWQGFLHAEIRQQPIHGLGRLLAVGILQGAGKPL